MHWNRNILVGGSLGGLIVTGAFIAYNWGATPRLSGEITEVRTLGMDASSSVAIVNIKATNTSNYELSIDYREVAVIDSEGSLLVGRTLSVFDIQQLFKYYPALGGMRDEPLVDSRQLASGETVRGLVAARFEIPKHELDMRKELIFRTADGRQRKTELRLSPE